ncbi:MAG: hypothetical protein HEP71_16715 [Roseivirga sp.]|nr:hypothetical protein [Roseivirga sp.]
MNNPIPGVWFRTYSFLASLLILAFAHQHVSAQSLKYDAFVDSEKIGEMTVVKEVNDEADKISVKGFYKIVRDSLINFKFESYATYMNGILMEAEAKTWFNDHKPLVTNTFGGQGDSYFLERSWIKVSEPLMKTELYGTDILYFEEPERLKNIYDLYTGGYMRIEPAKTGSYNLIFSNRTYLFQYKDGVLTEFTNAFGAYIITFKLAG